MELVELNEKEYKEFIEKNNAHFLQSYEWGQISKKRGLIPFYLGLKDKEIKATALLLKKNMPLGYSYFYIPRGYTIDYNNLELLKIFTLKIKEFSKKHKAIFFRIDPDIKLHTIDSNALKIEGENNYKLVDYLKKIGYKHRKLTKYFETMQPRYTFRIDLKDDLDTIESRYTTTTIQRIKKAIKYGVHVEIGTKEDIKEFVRLMKMTEKRQGFYSHNLSFYEDFYELFNKNNMVTLYLGKINICLAIEKLNKELDELKEEYNDLKELTNKKANNRKKEIEKNIKSIEEQLEFYKDKPKEDIAVSSYITVHYGNKSWALYAANDMDYKRMFANYLVYQRQIKDAKEKKKEIFDVFGTIGDPNSNSHLIGLHDFKKKWGGEYIEFIGEFDYILKPFINFIYNKVITIRHKIINKKLRKKGE